MPPWNSAKAKVQIRLSIQRLRTLQQKKEAQAKASRRDIATLLERGKIETARVKVETIIHEDIHVELLELLELYCELLFARFGLLEQNTREPDPGIAEGVASVIHAAPRTELKELHILRDILMHKYGREYSVAVMENRDDLVSDRVRRKLSTETPSPELVDAYITEIAKAYGVPWTPLAKLNEEKQEGLSEKDGEDASSQLPDVAKKGLAAEAAPKLPDIPPTEDESSTTPSKAAPTTPQSPPPKEEDEFEALAKRFAALKKR
ncbi:DUF292-domain-containing protein [Pluteus cervinus]|uniref:DUF292-domain-containing protein n=1 Tax=Pluteus cervinus TaxID=181527 RepID=A0ACD3BIE8_9AGAR|nr:DUF292-domain-containing protein [Pluteus cervinus]